MLGPKIFLPVSYWCRGKINSVTKICGVIVSSAESKPGKRGERVCVWWALQLYTEQLEKASLRD